MTEAQVRERIETEVRRAGTARALAHQWGVAEAYLSDVRAGRRPPGPKITAGLGLRVAGVRYERASMPSDTEAA